MSHGSLVVEPVGTEHTDAHVSHRVELDGVRPYFTGDPQGPELTLQHS